MLAVVLILVTVAMLTAEHYFPHWHETTGRKMVDEEGRVSPRRLIVNYTAGTLAWFGPFSVWLGIEAGWRVVGMGWVFLLAGGLTVTLLYALDGRVEKNRKMREMEELYELLMKKREMDSRDAESKRL